MGQMGLFFVAFAAVCVVIAAQAPKVNVTLYSESLCPDCQHYITTSWWDMWSSDAKDIINWGQVVWGNARLSPDGTITCQHGAAECDLNIMQDCAINVSTGPSQWVPFIHCLETHGTSQKQFVSKCATSAGIPINALNTCWQGPVGKALILAAAAATPSNHQYVPCKFDASHPCAPKPPPRKTKP